MSVKLHPDPDLALVVHYASPRQTAFWMGITTVAVPACTKLVVRRHGSMFSHPITSDRALVTCQFCIEKLELLKTTRKKP